MSTTISTSSRLGDQDPPGCVRTNFRFSAGQKLSGSVVDFWYQVDLEVPTNVVSTTIKEYHFKSYSQKPWGLLDVPEIQGENNY